MMNKQEMEKKRKQLRKQYAKVGRDDKLAWCVNQARIHKMSYGSFVTWLGV